MDPQRRGRIRLSELKEYYGIKGERAAATQKRG
jgi:hypothetical protein